MLQGVRALAMNFRAALSNPAVKTSSLIRASKGTREVERDGGEDEANGGASARDGGAATASLTPSSAHAIATVSIEVTKPARRTLELSTVYLDGTRCDIGKMKICDAGYPFTMTSENVKMDFDAITT